MYSKDDLHFATVDFVDSLPLLIPEGVHTHFRMTYNGIVVEASTDTENGKVIVQIEEITGRVGDYLTVGNWSRIKEGMERFYNSRK